jgi:hypothetical protein
LGNGSASSWFVDPLIVAHFVRLACRLGALRLYSLPFRGDLLSDCFYELFFRIGSNLQALGVRKEKIAKGFIPLSVN